MLHGAGFLVFAHSNLIVALIQVFKIICLIPLRLIGCIFASVILITRGICHNIAFLLTIFVFFFIDLFLRALLQHTIWRVWIVDQCN